MDIASRIQARLRQLELSANAASLRAGLPRDAIRDIIAGKSRNPRADTLLKIAAALEIDPAYLLDPNHETGGVSPLAEGEVALPIRYEVAAGAWMAHDDLREEPYGFSAALRLPEYERWGQWLERVRGDSMNRLVPDGSLVHVVDAVGMGYAPRHDDLVVVIRTRAQGAFIERSMKQISFGPSGVELWPRSHDPRWSSPLILSAGLEENEDATVEIVGLVVRAYMVF